MIRIYSQLVGLEEVQAKLAKQLKLNLSSLSQLICLQAQSSLWTSLYITLKLQNHFAAATLLTHLIRYVLLEKLLMLA